MENDLKDCFGTIPSPMTGGGTDWSQFQSNFSKEIAEFVVKLKLTKKDGFAGSSKKLSSRIYKFLVSLEKEEELKKDLTYIPKPVRILQDARKRAQIWKLENKEMGEKNRNILKNKLQSFHEDLLNSQIDFQKKKEQYEKQASDFKKAEENKKLAEELILLEVKNEQKKECYRIMLEEFSSLFPEDASSFKKEMKSLEEPKKEAQEKESEKKQRKRKSPEESKKESQNTETKKQKLQRLCKQEGLEDVGTVEQLKENYWKQMCRKRNLSDVGNAKECELRFKTSK